MAFKDSIKKIVKPLEDLGIKAENIYGTEPHKEKNEEFESGTVVLDEWNSGDSVYQQLFNRISGYRDFYLGETREQWAHPPEGELQLVFNMGAAVIDLFSFILGNSPPAIQFRPDGADPMEVTRADFGEDLTAKILDNARFPKRFKDGTKNQFLIGFVWMVWIWNPQNKDGGEKGTLELALLNPFTTRVKYSSLDSENLESIITTERTSQKEILKRYDYEALPDSEDPYIPESIPQVDDNMTTVFRRYGPNSVRTVINGREIDKKDTKYGFVPAVQIDNIKVLNDVHGYGEITRWQQIAQELNELLSAASEIARDLGYPPILEYNNALGGRKVDKWRGRKIPVRRTGNGEAIEYMRNFARLEPVIAQARLIIDLFHFISLMPKAAAGIFEATITSGFQAKLAMQPATLTTENRKVDWEVALKQMTKFAIRILEKENPKALEIQISKEKTIKFEGLADHEMQVVWPDNLPIDIAREIQNLVLGIQNNITSVRQAIDKYNVLMQMGSPTDTEAFLKKESKDPEANPERALKVAKAKEAVKVLAQTLDQASQKAGELGRAAPQGQGQGPLPENLREAARQANQTNLLRSAASPLPEERRATSQRAEGVPLESTGGVPARERRQE